METSTHQQHHHQASTKPANTKVLASLVFLSAFILLLPGVHNLVQLICINMNKNYMFLLFNGILVILKISRGGVGDSPEGSDLLGVLGTKEKEVHEPSLEMTKEVINLEEEEEEKEAEECKEEESSLVTEEVEEDDQQENGNGHGHGHGNVDEDEDDEIGLMELNRKFDDFIIRMRQGIKTEAELS